MWNEERTRAVKELVESTCSLLASRALSREILDEIKRKLLPLAARREFWSDFAPPSNDELQNRYLIYSHSDSGPTLYLNVMRRGKTIQPHNHSTWACVAAVEGTEVNRLYQIARREGENIFLQLEKTINLSPGEVVCLMPDDIHSVEIVGDEVIRHLHFYGQPLETLTERDTFDLASGRVSKMKIGVKSKV